MCVTCLRNGWGCGGAGAGVCREQKRAVRLENAAGRCLRGAAHVSYRVWALAGSTVSVAL